MKHKFTVSSAKVEEALTTLAAYLTERSTYIAEADYDLTQSINMMDALYRFKESVAERVKSPAEKLYDAMRFTVVPNKMDEQEVTSVTIEGVGRVNITDDVSVKVQDKQKLMEWLIANELEDMIQQTVNAQTLSAFIRRRMRAGEPLPSELIEVKPVVRAAITRS